ncbi:hypothetical protein K438DRAFT_1814484 [Mycena galopus ATCC 62051]|nr:hypothetical protein K438DRAFT_1814484 [Mycena galopus ATCC 62051]
MASNSEFRVGYQEVADCDEELAESLKMMPLDECPRRTILTLPNEITSEIFIHCLDPQFPSYATSTTNPAHAPMLLLHVCRAWRSIALSVPGLWTHLELHLYSFPQALFDAGNLEMFIEDRVARAGTRPLSLYLEGGHARREEELCLIPAILRRLSKRIRILELSDIQHFLENIPDFPLLQNLSLASIVGDNQGNGIQIFSKAPRLRELALYHTAPSCFTICWEALTVFTAGGLSSKDCIDVLRWAPGLVECNFDQPYLDVDPGIVSHPNLKSFRFYGKDLYTFFEFLAFPALEDLNMFRVTMDDNLHQFMLRSSSPLLRLSSDAVPVAYLSDMVALIEIKFRSLSSDDLAEFVGHLHRTTHPTFLPQLRAVQLESCPPHVDTLLVDALSSRCAVASDGSVALQSFRQTWGWGPRVTPPKALEDSYRVALEELVRKGLKIYIGPEDATGPGTWLFQS